MIRNYLKSLLRFLYKHKTYTLNNILGLSIGMASVVIIYLWILDELSFDTFHPNHERIYRFVQTVQNEDLEFKIAVSPAVMPPTFEEQFPEIIETARFRPETREVLVSHGDKKFYETKVAYADKEIFSLFSFRFISGSSNDPFPAVNSVIVTEKIAEKYFGEDDPTGKFITINEDQVFLISGVLENLPLNSHLKFDILCNFDILKSDSYYYSESWHDHNFYGYALLHEDADIGLLSEKFTEFMRENHQYESTTYWLQPLSDVHLRSDFDIDLYSHSEPKAQYILIFSFVGIFILLIAVFNYINLTTARSTRRAMEVGIRKVNGAIRIQLFRQFMSESFILILITYLIAMLVVELVIPFFNQLTGKELSVNYMDPSFAIGMGILVILTGFLSGVYPSLFLSSFSPIRIIKGDIKAGPSLFRKVLVFFQFFVAVFIIVCTGIIYKQLQYIQNRNIGLDKELVLYSRINGEMFKNFHSFKQELKNYPEIKNITYCSQLPTYTVASTSAVDWEGKEEETSMIIHQYIVDHDYIPLFGIELSAGRNFDLNHPSDSGDFILNEAAIRHMGLENPVGKRFQLWNREGTIIGVMKDFHFKSLHKKVEPLCLRLARTVAGYIFIKIEPDNIENTLKQVRIVWDAHNPQFPMAFEFLDNEYQKLYQSEQKLRSLFTLFALLAVFLSSLGLIGLTSFLTEKRTKEIGIRKAMGSSPWKIMTLFSWDTLKWILLSNLVAWPIAWWFMKRWLQGFAYKTEIAIWIFAAAAILVLIIAILSISFEVIRIARINPAVSLKYE